MPIYLQHGNLIDYVPPTDTSTEDVVFMGGLVGIPQAFIPAGELGALSVDGVYMFTKKDGVSVNLGEVVKYCGTTKLAQDNYADLTLGVAVADAEADSLGVKVKINSVLPTDGGGGGGGEVTLCGNSGLYFDSGNVAIKYCGNSAINADTNGVYLAVCGASGLSIQDGQLVASGGGGGGLQNLATGDYSLSILGAATTSPASTSVGVEANASGEQSVALGFQATASAKYSNAFGIGANASVLGAIAVGWQAEASCNNTVALGTKANAINAFSIAIGLWAKANEQDSIAIGDTAVARGISATAIGTETTATANYSTALGHKANASDTGVTVLSSWNDDGATKTQLYLIGAGSTMSTTYCDGEAGLGFVFVDSDGEIVKRGTIKLSAIMTENTDTFTPYEYQP